MRYSSFYFFFSFFFLSSEFIHGQLTQGPKSPSNAFNTNPGVVAWTTPANVYVSDDLWSEATTISLYTATKYLTATGFQFNIPSGAQILGIKVDVEYHADKAGKVTGDSIYLIRNSQRVGLPKYFQWMWKGYTDTINHFGSCSDLWNTTWTPADINSAGFGVQLVTHLHGAPSPPEPAKAFVDHIQISVCYSCVMSVNAGSDVASICSGGATGLWASGGSSYSWAPAGSLNNSSIANPVATPSATTTYTVFVSDAGGCTGSAVVTVSVPSQALAASVSGSNINCNGICSGTAVVSPSGGMTPYSYIWNTAPVQQAQTATGLCAGNYVCTVTDAWGCTKTNSVSITQPPALALTASSVNAVCGNSNGSATINATGGTPSYGYTWSPSGQNTSTATGLIAGVYSVTVTDSKGCSAVKTVTVSSTSGPSVTASATPAHCGSAAGSVSALPAGGTLPYSFLWSTGQTVSSVSGLGPGLYSVIVTDANGCTAQALASVAGSGSPTATASATSTSCTSGTGTSTAAASGGTAPYSYLWSNGQTTQTATGLSSGTYSVLITDVNGCTAPASATVTPVNGPSVFAGSDPSTVCAGDTVHLFASGGTGYQWSPSSSVSNPTVGATLAYPPVTTTYTVTVTSANGCTGTNTVTIQVYPCVTSVNENNISSFEVQVIPTVFSNEAIVELPEGASEYPFMMKIFDLSGREVAAHVLNERNSVLNRQGMKPGIHFFRIIPAHPGATASGKIIVVNKNE